MSSFGSWGNLKSAGERTWKSNEISMFSLRGHKGVTDMCMMYFTPIVTPKFFGYPRFSLDECEHTFYKKSKSIKAF
jgi:hypothetical protein